MKRRRALKTEIIIKLDTIENIKKFASAANKFHSDIDIIRGRYIIDGKSIVGIYAMGAENPAIVRINMEIYQFIVTTYSLLLKNGCIRTMIFSTGSLYLMDATLLQN